MGSRQEQQHWVALAGPAWGHTRSLLHLASNLLLRSTDVVVTILIHHSEVERCEKERERCLSAQSNEPALHRFIILPLQVDDNYVPDADLTSSGMPIFNLFDECKYAFGKQWEKLCTQSPAPTKLIVDLFLAPDHDKVKEISPNIKIFVWFSAVYASFWQHYAPRTKGGDGDARKYYEQDWNKEADQSKFGNNFLAYYVHRHANRGNQVMKVPGLPEYYDYERSPNHFPTPPPIATMWEIGIAQLLHNDKVDAILTASDEWYEPESSRESIKWYKESTGKDMISTGFPLLIGPQEKTTLSESRPGEEGIISFLDQQKEKSVVYISFGTVFFPLNNPEAVYTMFDVLLTTKRPFILSRASMFFGPQSEQFENRLKEAQEAGSCLVSEWTPQVKILAHKSTSVFVTHGGWNSTTEAIAANVPTVYWPFTADQPATAMRHSIDLDTSWEFLEVRGSQVKTEQPRRKLSAPLQGTPEALRAEFEQVFNETEVGNAVGDRKRKNMSDLSKRAKESLLIGGDVWNKMGELLAM